MDPGTAGPCEPWRLVRDEGVTRLERGSARDPDLAFCFPPAAIDELERTQGGVTDFALTLFRLMLEQDPERRVALRVIAPFPRLLAQLRRMVDVARRAPPEAWELEAAPPSTRA